MALIQRRDPFQAIQFWDGKKRRLKEKCFEDLPEPFRVVDNESGSSSLQTQQWQNAESLGNEIAAELGHTLKLLCSNPVEGVSVMIFVLTVLS